MAAPAGEAAHLRLERRRANLAFQSWRLSSSIVQAQGGVALPAPAVPPQAADTDYVTARHAALLNGLTQQPHGCYLFLEGAAGAAGAAGLQLCALELGEAGKPPVLRRLAGERAWERLLGFWHACRCHRCCMQLCPASAASRGLPTGPRLLLSAAMQA